MKIEEAIVLCRFSQVFVKAEGRIMVSLVTTMIVIKMKDGEN